MDGGIRDEERQNSASLRQEGESCAAESSGAPAALGASEAREYVKQAFSALEGRCFDEASRKCDKALDIYPEYAQAYLCKLLAELRLTGEEGLKSSRPFDRSENYKRALLYASSALADMLTASAKAARETRRRRLLTLGIVVLVTLVCLFCVITLVVIPKSRNETVINRAKTLLDQGAADDAFALLKKMEDDKNARYIMDTDPRLKFAVGQTVSFGRFEQDAVQSNGPEDLKWLIIAHEGDNVLLLSRYGLAFRPFKPDGGTVSWADSDIRKWLNTQFIQEAFTDDEAGLITMVGVPGQTADGRDIYVSDPDSGMAYDRVLLLSLDEAERYLAWNAQMAAGEFTPEAVKNFYVLNGKQMNDVENMPAWWTRSVIRSDDGGYAVETVSLTEDGYHKPVPANSMEVAVRPALWIYVGESGGNNTRPF